MIDAARGAQKAGAAIGVAGSVLLSACSYGLFQTAHTEPPGCVSGRVGLTAVVNDLGGGREPPATMGLEPGLRIGLTRRMDAGLATFHLTGAQADAKYNLLDPGAPFAVAPRLGLGYARGYDVWMARAGLLASYRLANPNRKSTPVEPYLGVTFSNYWIRDYEGDVADPNEGSRVEGTGTGDGLLEVVLGIELSFSERTALMLEAGHWFLMQNDPGDDYAFVPSNVVGLALVF